MKKNIYAGLLIVACAVSGSVYTINPWEEWKTLSPEELVSRAILEDKVSPDSLICEAIEYDRADVVIYLQKQILISLKKENRIEYCSMP